MANGKKIKADYEGKGEEQKERSLNGRRYAFDRYGAMTAEWSLDVEDAYAPTSTANNTEGYTVGDADLSTAATTGATTSQIRTKIAKYSHQWRYSAM